MGGPRGRRPPAEAVVLALPCNSQAVGEAALAADLITASIFHPSSQAPGLGPGRTGRRPAPRACKEGWKMCVFQTGFQFVNLRDAVVWCLKAPKTSISFVLEAKLSSRDQVGCSRSLPDGLGVAWERPEAVACQPKPSSWRSHATPKPSGRLR